MEKNTEQEYTISKSDTNKMLNFSFKPLVWETVSVLNIDDLIARNNQQERILKVNRGDLSTFCQYMTMEIIDERYMNHLTTTGALIKKTNHYDKESTTVIISKMMTISITYGFHLFKTNSIKLAEFCRMIFSFIIKLYQSQLIIREDVVLFLEYAWVLSFNSNNCSNTNCNEDNDPLKYMIVFRSAVISLLSLCENDSIKEIDDIIISLLEFLDEKHKQDFNIRHIVKDNDTMLLLLHITQYSHIKITTIEAIYTFLLECYQFNYKEHFLNLFISTVKDTLYDTYSLKDTNQHLTLLGNQLNFILEMFKLESSIKLKDIYQSDNGFLFNKHAMNGFSMQMTQGKGLNKSMSIVFSFKPFELLNKREYPLITFVSNDSKTLFFRLVIKRDCITFTSRTTLQIAYDFKSDQTYLVILEWKKDSILSSKVSIDLTVNGEKLVLNTKKEEIDLKIDDRFIIKIGTDPFDEENNFIGQINPIIVFKKNFDNSVYSLLSDLHGAYSSILNYCAGYDMKHYDKYSSSIIMVDKGLAETVKFFRDNCVMVISPYSVINQRQRRQLQYPEIYYDFRKEAKEDLYYEFKVFPSTLNCCTYPVVYNMTSKEFLNHKGIELMNLHLEYYYNLMMKTKEKEYVNAINKGIDNTLLVINYYLSSTDIPFDSIRKGLNSYLFSLGKLIYLICDYSIYLNQDITTEIISLYNALLTIGRKECYSDNIYIKSLCAKLFTFVLDPRFYDMTNNLILKKLFSLLCLYLDEFTGSEDIISTTTLTLLIQFNLLLSPNQLLDHYILPNKISIHHTAKSSHLEYKKMRTEYQLLLCSFIQKCHYNILYKFLNHIFSTDYTLRIQYKLLKMYYLSRNKYILESFEKKQTDIWQTYNELFTTQNNAPPLENKDDEQHRELIKSILLQLLFEHKSKSNLLNNNEDSRSKDIHNNTTGLIRLTKNKMNSMDESSLIDLSYQSTNTIGEPKSPDNSIVLLINIAFSPPISIHLVKSIFMLNYDFWDPKAKTSFIADNKTSFSNTDNHLLVYNCFNLCLNKFDKSKKNHIAYFIQVLYKLDYPESRFTLDSSILLFINYLYQVYRAFSQSQQFKQQNIECQYYHLFESKAIMCAFFTLAVDSPESFKYTKAFFNEIVFTLVWKNRNCFIYKFVYSSIKKDAYDMIYLMKLIISGFNSNIILLSKNEKIPEDKCMNIIEFIIVAYKLFVFNKIPKDLVQNDTLAQTMITLIQSLKDKSAFLYSNILIPVSKKRKLNKTLYEIVIELLFKITELTENLFEIEETQKILMMNKNSICFLADLRRRKRDKKDKYKEVIKESDVLLCDNEFKAKYNIKESEGKLGMVILYIHTMKFIKVMKDKGNLIDLYGFISQIQSELLEIYYLLGTTYNDKDIESIYNKVIKHMALSFRSQTGKGNECKPSTKLFESINHIITNEEEKGEIINDKVSSSSMTENKQRKDSFSICPNKCKDTTHSKVDLTLSQQQQQMKYPIRINPKDKPIPSVFQIDEDSILCIKRDLLLKHFGLYFKDIYFHNINFNKLKRVFKTLYPPSDKSNSYFTQNEKQELNYPSKIKNYSNAKCFFPKIFFKQNLDFFANDQEYLKYFCPYLDTSFINEKSLKLHHGLMNKTNFRLFSDKSNNSISSLFKYPCERISIENICFGYLYVFSNFLIYQSDINFNPEDEYITNPAYTFSSFLYDVHQKPKQIIIPICLIQEVISRRYLFRNQAIELYLSNGKSYYFNLFNTQKQSDLITQLGNLNNKISLLINHKKEFFEVNAYHLKWKNEKMSNFDYLLQVNKYSGRSYNDINQYPILPWFFIQLKPQLIRRNFQLPISVQKEEAKAKALHKYAPSWNENEINHYNIHYSNCAFINTFLIRIQPYTLNQFKFQSYRFDLPDRQFHSLDSLLLKLSGNLDNRELIPEIFSMSEYALNLNYCEFGRRTYKDLINNLELADVFSSPVSQMIFFKNSFNANPVKEKIHQWLDYTFGIKQEENTKECLTVFPKLTYESFVLKEYDRIEKEYVNDVKKMMEMIRGIKENLFTIGQIPYQLFDNLHLIFSVNQGSKEKDFLDPVREVFYDNQLINKSLTNKKVALVSKVHNSNNVFFLTRKSPIKTLIVTEQDLNIINKVTIDKVSYLDKTNDGILIYHPKYAISEVVNSDTFITCRYYNNTIKLFIFSKKVRYAVMTDSFASAIKVNTSTSFYSGHQNGKVIEWTICYNEGVFDCLKEVKSIKAHNSRVNAIEVNRKYETIITGGDDNMIYIRKMFDFELLTVIDLKDNYIPVDIQISSMFNLIYAKVFNTVTNLFHLALYTMNGLCFEELAPVQWFEFLISGQNKVLYLDTSSNTLYQMSRDLKQKMKNAKLKGEVSSFTYLKREKTVIYAYDIGNFEKMHFELI